MQGHMKYSQMVNFCQVPEFRRNGTPDLVHVDLEADQALQVAKCRRKRTRQVVAVHQTVQYQYK